MSTAQMTSISTELALLKIITKQGYRNKDMKDFLVQQGYMTKAGNVTSTGKDVIYNFYKDLQS